MSKQRAKMPPSQRAKQFAPFDAVVGLRQALREKEKIKEKRKELSEDMICEINNNLKNLNIGDSVTVVHYNAIEQAYITTTGKIERIVSKNQTVTITGSEISFEDIYTITPL